ncbi:hypothetical protein M5689_000008 [Euphorbia peplus]|nr:hypothetical protein M5689_000008 [Euphorbia peplus]
MKVLFWNCRGIAHPPTQRLLYSFFMQYHPDFICLAEPMINFSDLPTRYLVNMGMRLVVVNDRALPSLWVFCQNDITSITLVRTHEQFVVLDYNPMDCVHRICFIYGSTLPRGRLLLWG